MAHQLISFIIKIFFTPVLAFIVKFLIEYFYLKYKLRKIPTAGGLPFFGISLDILKIPIEDRQAFLVKVNERFKGNLFVSWLGTRPFINIQKPRQMEVLLSSSVNVEKSVNYDYIISWLGSGLLTSKGKQWYHQRRFLAPSFHVQVLESFIEVFYEKSIILNERFKSYVSNNPGMPLNVMAFSSKFTLDIFFKTAMGLNINFQETNDNEYSEGLRDYNHYLSIRLLKPWLSSDFLYSLTEDGKKFMKAIKKMQTFTYKVLKEKIEEHKFASIDDSIKDEFGKPKRKMLLELMLDDSKKEENPLSIHEIREQVDTFTFAGHDTTAMTISWALFALSNATHIQDKIREELKDIFGDDDNMPITNVELKQMKYLEQVIKETLRLYPVAPFISRALSKDTVFDGYSVPKGCSIAINVFHLHRDPEIWENPLKFDPDRFLPENCKGRHPYAFIPFSAGPRNCIGHKYAMLELKVALASILRKWLIKKVKAVEEIKFQSDLILRASKPVEVILEPLKQSNVK